MNNAPHVYLRKAVKLSILAGMAMSLSGCLVALPPAVQLASLALDGVSYVATGKSVTDHAISAVTAQDCAMLRGLKGETICTDNVVEVAMLPDGTPAPQAPFAMDAARDIKTGAQDADFQAFSAARSNVGNEDLDEILDPSKTTIDMITASGPML